MTRRPSDCVGQIASRLTPFQQGQFDALCGFYCTLNALQIASHPKRIGLRKAQNLFASAISMMRKRRPHLNPVTQGMTNERMIWFAEHIAELAGTCRTRFVVERCVADDVEQWVRQSLYSGYPVIACFSHLHHFSVVVDVANSGLAVFDSQPRSWVPVEEGKDFTDVIDRRGTIRIRRDTPTPYDANR